VRRGQRFDQLAAVLPDPAGCQGAASHDADEADHPVRCGCGGRAERGAAGQGGWAEAAAGLAAARGHHGGAGERGLPGRLGAAGQGGPPDRGDRAADRGCRRGDADQGPRPQPRGRPAGCWRRPGRSPRRPGSGWPARCPAGRPGGSACTSRTLARSPKAVSAKPVEFGDKAQVTDNDDGIIADYAAGQGNPTDGPQLAPAVERVIKRAGRKPATVTADRSYGEQSIEDDRHGPGVRHVVIPRKGKPGKTRQAAERRPAFRRAVKWRTGSEGRISTLKRGYGWERTRLDGTKGARTWAGHGVLAHNPGQDQRASRLTGQPAPRPLRGTVTFSGRSR
jgi:IS5 family transposase